MSLDANFLRLVEIRQNDDHTSSLWTREKLEPGLLIGVLDKGGENDANALLLLNLIRPLANSESNFNILVRSVQQKICLQTSREIEVNERLIADREIEIEQHLHDSGNDNDDDDDDDDDEDMVAEDCLHMQRHSLRKLITSFISLPPSPSSSQSSSPPSSLSSSLSPSSASSSISSNISRKPEAAIAYPTTTITSSNTANIITSRQQLRQQQHYSER
ncbi:unnamed protein product [Cercopithifilaria johnstoni]|uniref:Uncharacterized protein n=1 Tax=Cercopithifilaria johnstoni TaxID=2874296 RepID=A0A8J2LZM1_9BILA|nr:unnamed protein product [Cercopithifilaria johnstoni]